MEVSEEKRHGVHYTPTPLADFLANEILRYAKLEYHQPRILDPACGDGALLAAIQRVMPLSQPQLFGFDIDEQALSLAKMALPGSAQLFQQDFLVTDSHQPFDLIISNPPYVRTQVLGSEQSQWLAREYGLSGRVDLYHVFAVKIASLLKSGGVVGLLTSNRFLTTKSGNAMRELLEANFNINAVFDLGDTRLFEAAVLPAIVIATKKEKSTPDNQPRFVRVYREESQGDLGRQDQTDLLETLSKSRKKKWVRGDHVFAIERGRLVVGDSGQPWRLTNNQYERWLNQIHQHQDCTFGDLASVKVESRRRQIQSLFGHLQNGRRFLRTADPSLSCCVRC